ncbi:34713_t:CDS:1, partial [Gigaspora margarita]
GYAFDWVSAEQDTLCLTFTLLDFSLSFAGKSGEISGSSIGKPDSLSSNLTISEASSLSFKDSTCLISGVMYILVDLDDKATVMDGADDVFLSFSI